MDILQPAKYLEYEGLLLVLIGAVIQAYSVINNKKLIKKKVSTDVIVACYCLLTGILFFAAASIFNPPKFWSVFDMKLGIFWPLVFTCVLNLGVQFGNTKALKYADASLVAPMGAFQPFISLWPAWLILGETPTHDGYYGLLLIAVGLYLFSFSQKIKDPSKVPSWAKTQEGKLRMVAPIATLFTNPGVQLAFLATACGAISVNFDKRSALLSSYMFAPGVIYCFVGIAGVIKSKKENWKNLKKEHVGRLCLAGVLYFAVNVFYWSAFQYGLAMYISALKKLNSLFVLPMAYFFLKEKAALTGRRWIGVAVFVSGIFLLTLK